MSTPGADEHSLSKRRMVVALPDPGACGSLDERSHWRGSTANLSLTWGSARAWWLSGVAHPALLCEDQAAKAQRGTVIITGSHRRPAAKAEGEPGLQLPMASVPGLRLTARIVTLGKSLRLSEISHMEDG